MTGCLVRLIKNLLLTDNAGPSDCLVTKMKSLRIAYLIKFPEGIQGFN